ncbi:MAG: ThuA domain-containing protein [Rubritalea sp.]|jgi:type 1 glutamine amidotransferase
MKSPRYLFSILLTLSVPLISMISQASTHPVAESPQWLTFEGGEGPGKGQHIVLITAEQEYRSEQSFPMMAGILAKHHGFHCTVLFGVNEDGLVDPTMPVFPKKGEEDKFKSHSIPGLEHLAKADLVIFKTRLLTLPEDQKKHIVNYIDSGKPIIGIRTANHGFRGPLPYKIDGKQVNWGKLLGGAFMKHHGNWHRDSTRGDIVEAMKAHPILTGVKDIWGPSDVYRTYKEGDSLPADCTALVFGQPLIGREKGGASNPKKVPLPVVWFKDWKTSDGKTARVVQSTMGSGKDLESPGLRRLIINAAYWSMGMEKQISPTSSVDYTGEYQPLVSGFQYEKLGVIPQIPAAYRPQAKK